MQVKRKSHVTHVASEAPAVASKKPDALQATLQRLPAPRAGRRKVGHRAKTTERTPQALDAKLAIERYVRGSECTLINAYLRHGQHDARMQKRVDTLNAALLALPPSAGMFNRFLDLGGVANEHGTAFDFAVIDHVMAQFKAGAAYVEPAFMSTTTNQIPSGKFTHTFVNVRMRIHGKSARDIQKVSNTYPEAESIFTPGTCFRVKAVRGEMVESWSRNELPVAQWQAFVKHYQRFFPDVDAQAVAKAWAEHKVPNLLIELQER